MALTRVSGGILKQPIDVGIITATSLNASGIVTAGTVQVGSATTIHTTGIDLGSGNVTSHNINSTGIITATSFVGPVTGNLTGNVTGNVTGNLTGNVTGNLTGDVTGNLTGNADTASNLTGSPSITVTNITASGNVSIAGTLTYEDVTNIDSVGIITAQGDISIADKIVHTGDTNTAIRFPAADTFTVETAGSERLRITSDGSVGTGGLVPSSGNLVVNSTIRSQNASNHTSYIGFTQYTGSTTVGSMFSYMGGDGRSSGYLNFSTNNTEKLRITSAGNIGIGTDNPQGKLVVSDGSNGLEFNPNSNNAIVSYNRTTSAYAPNGLQGSTVQLRIGGVGTALHVHSDGKVGIGTDNPSKTLTVYGDSSSSLRISKSGVLAYDHTFDGSTYTIANNNGSAGIPIIIGTKTAGGESLRITSGGRVSIGGVSAPNQELHIHGTGTSYIQFSDESSGTGASDGVVIGLDHPHTYVWNYEAGDFIVATNATEKFRITSAGLIGIGVDSPAVKLDVKRATAGTIARFYDTGSNGGALYNGGPIVGLSRVSNGSVSLDGLLFQVGIDKNSSTSYNIDETVFSVTNTGVGIGIHNPSSTYLLEADGPIRSGSGGSSLPKGAGFRQHAVCSAGLSNRLIYNTFDGYYAEKSFSHYFPNAQSNRALRIHSNRSSWWTCGFITIHSSYSNQNASGMLRYHFRHNANGTSDYGKSIDVDVNIGYTSSNFGMSSSYSFKTWGSNGGSTTSHALELRHLTSTGNGCYVTVELYGSSASTYIDDLYMTTGHTY